MTDKLGFLDLPLLVRSEIYSLVLGGQTIHICGGDLQLSGKRGSVALCQDSSHDDLRSGRQLATRCGRLDGIGQTHRIECLGTDGNLGRAQAGKLKEPSRVQLHLLQLCREIHMEARLVPFKENIFNCADLMDLAQMLSKLTDTQVAAIRHMTVYSMDRDVQAWNLSGVRKKKLINNISRLRGLRTLRVYVEFGRRVSKYNPYYSCTSRITSADRQMMIEGMKPFSNTGLAQTGQLHIRFTDIGPCMTEIPWAYLKAWEKELREAILPGWPEESDIPEDERHRRTVIWPRDWRYQGQNLGPQNPGSNA